MKRQLLSSLLRAGLCGGLLLIATAASALERDTVLGSSGEIYRIRPGVYGELFPGGHEAEADAQVLALEVVRPGADLQRFLVPETQGKLEESLPALVYEDESSSVFLVWVSRVNSLHSIFKLASFDGGRFSNPIDVTGNPFAAKASPQLAITRDSYEEAGLDGLMVTKRRTILQLAWEEQVANGGYETFFTPIILEDGTYLGWNPVFRLNDFDPGASGPGGTAASNLVLSPAVQNGHDGRTLVVAFTSGGTGRLTTLEIDILPRELVRLSDLVRSTIIDTGVRLSYPQNLRELSNQAKLALQNRGLAFHPEMLDAISTRINTQILTGGPTQTLTALAGLVRSTIIDTGSKFSDRGLRSFNDAAPMRTVEVSRGPGISGPTTNGPSHFLQFRVASSRLAPNVGGDAPVRVFLSGNGEDVSVAWNDGEKILYRDSRGQGWSDPREFHLSDSLDLQRAYEILGQRVHDR
jgi:hypothetical protein